MKKKTAVNIPWKISPDGCAIQLFKAIQNHVLVTYYQIQKHHRQTFLQIISERLYRKLKSIITLYWRLGGDITSKVCGILATIIELKFIVRFWKSFSKVCSLAANKQVIFIQDLIVTQFTILLTKINIAYRHYPSTFYLLPVHSSITLTVRSVTSQKHRKHPLKLVSMMRRLLSIHILQAISYCVIWAALYQKW